MDDPVSPVWQIIFFSCHGWLSGFHDNNKYAKKAPQGTPFSIIESGRLLLAPLFFNSQNGCFNIFSLAKGRKTEITFTTGAEAAAGGTNNKAVVE